MKTGGGKSASKCGCAVLFRQTLFAAPRESFELSGCFLFLCGGGGAPRVDYGDQLCADGGAEAGAGVPAGAGLEAYWGAGVVGAGGDVVEGGFAFGGVDGGLDEAGGLAVLRV